MPKKEFWNNKNIQKDIEWGNIDMGVPDETFHTHEFAHKLRSKHQANSETFKKAIKRRSANEEWHNNRNKALAKKRKTKEWKKNHAIAQKKKFENPKTYAKIVEGKRRDNGLKVRIKEPGKPWKTFDYLAKAVELYNAPTLQSTPHRWFPYDGSIRTMTKGNMKGFELQRLDNIDPSKMKYQKKEITVIVTPFGEFPSKMAAVKYVQKNNLYNNPKKQTLIRVKSAEYPDYYEKKITVDRVI